MYSNLKKIKKKKEKIQMKINNKGITLIALVITIIILLILAAVAIQLALGDNGLITRARSAQKDQTIAESIDTFKTLQAGVWADYQSKPDNRTQTEKTKYIHDLNAVLTKCCAPNIKGVTSSGTFSYNTGTDKFNTNTVSLIYDSNTTFARITIDAESGAATVGN